jgi:DNA-binding response OmpR family regulator
MSPESTKPLKVLVAEDEPAMLSLVVRHMRSLGFSVVEASEGDVAWELAQEHRPDLVILDVMMPGMSGWEVCRRIKGPSAEGAFANTGVIMLTGIGENLNDMTSPLFAADTWLNKPFDFNDLDTKIRETLERYAKALPAFNRLTLEDEGNDTPTMNDEPAAEEPPVEKRPEAKATAKKPAGSAVAKKSAGSAAAKKSAGNAAAKKPPTAVPPAKNPAKKSSKTSH